MREGRDVRGSGDRQHDRRSLSGLALRAAEVLGDEVARSLVRHDTVPRIAHGCEWRARSDAGVARAAFRGSKGRARKPSIGIVQPAWSKATPAATCGGGRGISRLGPNAHGCTIARVGRGADAGEARGTAARSWRQRERGRGGLVAPPAICDDSGGRRSGTGVVPQILGDRRPPTVVTVTSLLSGPERARTMEVG